MPSTDHHVRLAPAEPGAGFNAWSSAAGGARVVEQQQAGWRDPKYPKIWLSSLEHYAFTRIGKLPVSEVTSADLLEVLGPIWHVKARTARTVRQRMRAVLEWAVAMELRTDNPCDRIGRVLGPQNDVVQHMRALPHSKVASAIQSARPTPMGGVHSNRQLFPSDRLPPVIV